MVRAILSVRDAEVVEGAEAVESSDGLGKLYRRESCVHGDGTQPVVFLQLCCGQHTSIAAAARTTRATEPPTPDFYTYTSNIMQ